MVGAIQRQDTDRFLKALQCFCIIPQFALSKLSQRVPRASEFRKRLFSFLEGNWDPPRQSDADHKDEGNNESELPEPRRRAVKRASVWPRKASLAKPLMHYSQPPRNSLAAYPLPLKLSNNFEPCTRLKINPFQIFPQAPSMASQSSARFLSELAGKLPTAQHQTFSDGLENYSGP